MSKQISILHISDLHRISAQNVDCLRASFEVEKEYYIANNIPMPSYIVVSGDIVNGSKEQDATKAKQEIKEQYNVASKFLSDLCDIFLYGIRDNMIIIPGNHDVSQYVSISSMTKINAADVSTFVNALSEEDTNIRWSWKDLCFYKITNEEIYNERFQDFIAFYDEFYKEGKVNRKFPTDSNKSSYLLDFKEDNVTFACFNSCYHLDHLQNCGYISANSLASLSRDLLEKRRQGRFIIAVWHHHTHGLPKENNYLNYRILDNMSKYGIRMALHGHQHICGILNAYRDVFTQDQIWMVSAGTLYGNKNDMIPGTHRQFNLLIVERENQDCHITLQSREDFTMLNTQPVWNAGTIGTSNSIEYTFNIELEDLNSTDTETELKNAINIINIEAEKSGNYSKAVDRLLSLDTNNQIVRSFLIEYLVKENDPQRITKILSKSHSPKEAIIFLEACMTTSNTHLLHVFMDSTDETILNEPNVRAMLNDVKTILKL